MPNETPEALASWVRRQYGAFAPDYVQTRLAAAEQAGDAGTVATWRRAAEICRSWPRD
jgi:hypothetical protein